MFRGKKILLGVTGSIAAYKSAFLVRLLVKEGAEVKVVMTPPAQAFITPLTLATLSKNPVKTEFFEPESGVWSSHVELGKWADLFLVAPATANTMAKFAGGICDNLLTAVYLSAGCPVFIAPAMDLDMYRHAATARNIKKLRERGNIIIESGFGELASGLTGAGRMAEPEDIMAIIGDYLRAGRPLAGKRALVTAGPTYEAIDPVRFIGNRSTGKMGFAIAEELALMGATVTLVCGPSNQNAGHPGIEVIKVESAGEMFEAVKKHFRDAAIIVLAAAVADYKPVRPAKEKLKKKEDRLVLKLEKTVDIAAYLGKIKQKNQVIAGFALETNNETENALKKLKSKNLDLIVLNSLRDEGAGFGYDTNKVTIFDRTGDVKTYDLKSKREVAADIVRALLDKLHD